MFYYVKKPYFKILKTVYVSNYTVMSGSFILCLVKVVGFDKGIHWGKSIQDGGDEDQGPLRTIRELNYVRCSTLIMYE